MTRTITIPRVPFSMNQVERMHWTKWQREKKEWMRDVFFLLKESGNSIPMHQAHITIKKIVVYFDQVRTRDESNYEPVIMKPFLDALVHANIIPDDTAEFVTRAGKAEIQIDRQKPRTEVTLEW